MFIDVCYPNNNEEEYIELAKKLSTDALFFIYEKNIKSISKPTFKIYSGLRGDFPYACFLYNKRTYFILDGDKRINHVLIKELKPCWVGISFNKLINKQMTKSIENISLAIRLCKKYKVNLFIASFAKTPHELRSKKELLSLAECAGMDKNNIVKALELLDKSIN